MEDLGLGLHYRSEGGWHPLPTWAYFFIRLGEQIAERVRESNRSTTAISLPTKAFIAPLIGIGILSYTSRQISIEQLLEVHFRTIGSLEVNTLVWYRKNNRVIKAKFLGVTEFQGEQRLVIQIQSSEAGRLSEYVRKKDAFRIQISQNQGFRLPNNQQGRQVVAESPFSRVLLGEQYLEVMKNPDTKVCFIGIKDQFENEIMKTVYSVRQDDDFLRGTLNDVLRVKQFLNNLEPYQTEFLSSLARRNESELRLGPDTVVIYSGSIGYLHWKEDYKASNVVVLLDRSEPQFELAVAEINNMYVESNRFSSVVFDLGEIPKGIELLYWEETR
jgi:hypothetical protein